MATVRINRMVHCHVTMKVLRSFPGTHELVGLCVEGGAGERLCSTDEARGA